MHTVSGRLETEAQNIASVKCATGHPLALHVPDSADLEHMLPIVCIRQLPGCFDTCILDNLSGTQSIRITEHPTRQSMDQHCGAPYNKVIGTKEGHFGAI